MNTLYEPPQKYLWSDKCIGHECCGYCDKCFVPRSNNEVVDVEKGAEDGREEHITP